MHLNKVFKNAGILAGGDVLAALLGLISFAILARSLGVNSLGLFTVIITYVTLIDKFVNFQSWQALIRFCDKIKNDKSKFENLLSFGLFIDLLSAFVAFLISVTLCQFISSFFDWTQETLDLIKVYSLVILFNIEGTPTAIFRIGNKFIIFSKKAAITASIKLLLFVICWFYTFEIQYYIYSTLVAQIIGYLFFFFQALKYANLRPWDYLRKKNIDIVLENNPKFLSFILSSNIQTTLKLTTSLLDVLLVSKFVGNYAVGLLQLTKQFSKIFKQISSPLYKSVYPELTSLWNSNKFKEFKFLIIRSMKIMTIFSISIYIIFLLLGKYAIVYYVGEDFVGSYNLMLYYFIGVLISASTFSLTPAFLAMNLPKIPLITTFLSSLLFVIIFFLTYKELGYLAIGVSFASMTLFWVFQNVIIFNYKMKNL